MNIRQIKHYNTNEVFQHSQIGIIWEFYCSKEDTFIVEDLSKLTAKNITLTNTNDHFPTFSSAVLIKEYESKRPKFSLSLGTQAYQSMVPIIEGVNRWLDKNAQTSFDTSMRVVLAFDHRHLQTFQTISEMDVSRLILKFDESYIYKRLNEQIGSPFAMSIKRLTPINGYVNVRRLSRSLNNNFNLPNSNFYGIDFSSQPMGVLGFNYIGGKDYPSKNSDVMEILEYYVIKTYQSLNETEYTKFEIDEMDRLTKDLERAQLGYYDMNEFIRLFPDIKIAVDLKMNEQVIKAHWSNIRNTLFETITGCHITKGEINYDTTIGKFQLRNCDIRGASLNNFDLVKCKVNGVLENCELRNCEIEKSRIYSSDLVRGNKVKRSYLYGVKAGQENELNECCVSNNGEILNCTINESVVKFAGLGKNVKLDEGTVIVQKKETKMEIGQGMTDIKEIRDYKWMKGLNKDRKEDHIFGNEYKRKT